MTCVICCEPIPEYEKERLVWPTCNHVFHKICAMNACQYSIKCPMCRHEDDGITARQITILDVLREHDTLITDNVNRVIMHTEPNESFSFTDLNERLQDSLNSYENNMRARRNYMSKRRRLIRSNTKLSKLNVMIKKEEYLMKDVTRELKETWSEIMKHEWKNNVKLCDTRSNYNRKRDVLTRHRRELKKIIETHIGPEPELF